MHKDFYASGFLYHSLSEQILLQQKNSSSSVSSPWLLFGDLYLKDEAPETGFKNTIFDLLGIQIEVVHPVYSYFNETIQKNQYINYSPINTQKKFASKDGLTFEWFTFKEILKLQITPQTKHDIVVGQRVIEAAERKRLGLHTFQ